MNLYLYLRAWIIKKGYWIKHGSMRKFQKVIRIDEEPFGFRFHLEPLGEFNNVDSVDMGKNNSIECRYKRVPFKQYPDETYPTFKL